MEGVFARSKPVIHFNHTPLRREVNMPHETKTSCSTEGCQEPHLARGYCRKHYQQLQVTGAFGGSECSEPLCERVSSRRGLCGTHYQALRRKEGAQGAKCSTPGCSSPSMSRNLCDRHYQQFRRDDELQTRCAGPECDLAAVNVGVCAGHYSQVRAGKTLEEIFRKEPGSWGDWRANSKGYMVRRRTRNGRREQQLEHRFVMEEVLGRGLKRHEEVHHKNGQRGDNRRSNLELWSTSQPKGQRVEDKTAWAIEWLEQYAPERLA